VPPPKLFLTPKGLAAVGPRGHRLRFRGSHPEEMRHAVSPPPRHL